MTTTLYGIPNCDTIKKARVWLDAHGIAYAFHDWRKDGVDVALITRWIDELGWEALLNRSGTTFRKLPDADRADLDGSHALAIMIAHPAVIRRPVLERCGTLLVGFAPARYEAALLTGD
jgi:arsenate reductase